MKKRGFLRGLAILVILMVAGLNSYGQYIDPPSATYEAVNTDYITIGARIPYYVAPDAIIAAMQVAGTMDYSGFSWRFTTPANADLAGLTAVTYAGGATTPTAQAGFITQNEVSVVWGGAAITSGNTYNVRAIERSNPLSGIANGCNGDEEVRDVIVLPRPTVAWPAASGGGCGITPGAGTTFYVPIDVTGLGEWQVTYSVTYNGAAYLASTTSGDLGTQTAVTSDATVVGDAAAVKNLPNTLGNGIPVTIDGGTPAGGYGYYDVTITNITDRISRKSLDMTLVASQVGDIPATSYRIFVNPTPNTTPIQHLQNL